MFNVITAPEPFSSPDSTVVFLAGGIQNCIEWQDILIRNLKTVNFDKNVWLANPRRENFPIGDPSAADEQIRWEFEMLERCDIFSIYFANSDSPQPICFYELGRNIERMKQKFPKDWPSRIVVTCEKDFKRSKDVLVQTELATDGKVKVNLVNNDSEMKEHCKAVLEALNYK